MENMNSQSIRPILGKTDFPFSFTRIPVSRRGEGCDTKIPSSKKAAHHPCEPIRSPNTVIPSEAEGSLLHCRHMHTCALTQTTPWCFLFRLSLIHGLPVCKKDPSTSALMTGGRRIASHSLSHRCVDPSCAFGATLLQGPTRIVYNTDSSKTCNVSPR